MPVTTKANPITTVRSTVFMSKPSLYLFGTTLANVSRKLSAED